MPVDRSRPVPGRLGQQQRAARGRHAGASDADWSRGHRDHGAIWLQHAHPAMAGRSAATSRTARHAHAHAGQARNAVEHAGDSGVDRGAHEHEADVEPGELLALVDRLAAARAPPARRQPWRAPPAPQAAGPVRDRRTAGCPRAAAGRTRGRPWMSAPACEAAGQARPCSIPATARPGPRPAPIGPLTPFMSQ